MCVPGLLISCSCSSQQPTATLVGKKQNTSGPRSSGVELRKTNVRPPFVGRRPSHSRPHPSEKMRRLLPADVVLTALTLRAQFPQFVHKMDCLHLSVAIPCWSRSLVPFYQSTFSLCLLVSSRLYRFTWRIGSSGLLGSWLDNSRANFGFSGTYFRQGGGPALQARCAEKMTDPRRQNL
jgi:hypothetical protein